ncbi:MAG TPA: PilT/PilU family type 4a pilus ATPase [Planctomycetota bacterium]|nr:PilT/PilU family type 4a pilus ATPase [Planctomycetota bacterium]
MTSLDEFLSEARQRGASDLHLSAGAVPYVRVEGEIVRLPRAEIEPAEADALAGACAERGGVGPGSDVDFCFEATDLGRFRVNLHRHARGTALAIKCIPLAVVPLAELGLPESLNEATWFRTGMVLATGPAGCGKTCTLAALLQQVNRSRREHIVTIEEPIEFVFPSESCNVTQRQVGPHTRSFSNALRAALREDPNVILVSELRDVETIRTAVVAAETGHLVLGTLHTRDAASTVSRLIDVFPPAEQDQIRTMIAASLRTVISQRLLPRLGGGRRVPAYEILQVTPAVANVIREGRTHQIASQLQTGRRAGMIDLDARLEEMVAEGLIDRATAAAHAKNRKRFEDAP